MVVVRCTFYRLNKCTAACKRTENQSDRQTWRNLHKMRERDNSGRNTALNVPVPSPVGIYVHGPTHTCPLSYLGCKIELLLGTSILENAFSDFGDRFSLCKLEIDDEAKGLIYETCSSLTLKPEFSSKNIDNFR